MRGTVLEARVVAPKQEDRGQTSKRPQLGFDQRDFEEVEVRDDHRPIFVTGTVRTHDHASIQLFAYGLGEDEFGLVLAIYEVVALERATVEATAHTMHKTTLYRPIAKDPRASVGRELIQPLFRAATRGQSAKDKRSAKNSQGRDLRCHRPHRPL